MKMFSEAFPEGGRRKQAASAFIPRTKMAPTGGWHMASIPFDTLKFVKTLEAAGIPASQAEAFSAAVRDSHESVDVATKRDLKELEVSLRHDIGDLRKEMKEQELRLTIKLGTIVVVALGAFTALSKWIVLTFFCNKKDELGWIDPGGDRVVALQVGGPGFVRLRRPHVANRELPARRAFYPANGYGRFLKMTPPGGSKEKTDPCPIRYRSGQDYWSIRESRSVSTAAGTARPLLKIRWGVSRMECSWPNALLRSMAAVSHCAFAGTTPWAIQVT